MPSATNTPDGDQGTSEVSPKGKGEGDSSPEAGSGFERINIRDDCVDVDGFGDDINAPNAPRQHLPRTLRDTGSDFGYDEVDRSGASSHYAVVAPHDRDLKKSGHTTVQTGIQASQPVEGSNTYQEPGFEDNRQQQIIAGYTSGGIASGIQAALMPTPQQKNQQLEEKLQKSQRELAEARGHLDAHMRELKRSQGEVRQMGHHINGLDHERQRLKEANQSYENELLIVRTELQDSKNLASIRGKELVGLKVKFEEANQSYRDELSIVLRELQGARDLAEIRGKELVGLKAKEADQCPESELSILHGELEDAKNLASIRGKWLQGAEVFLTKADTLSVSEVIEKVTNLNEEIFQAAALLGEILVHKPHDVTQDQMTYALGISQGMIGNPIINILREQSLKKVPEVNPLIAQIVLQVFLVAYCSQMVQSWSGNATAASHLAAIYSRIRDKEEQAVSGRWRSLTRNHDHPTPDGWKEDLLRKLGSILRIASWMTPTPRHRDAFEQKLEPIFRAVEDLRDALGEKFISADLEVSVMEADQVFQPTYMDDAYGDPDGKPAGKHAPHEVIVGTTGIGLRKLRLKRSAKGELVFVNVLSAKVALESTLVEALRPPPRSGRKKKNPKPLRGDPPSPPKQATSTGTRKSSSSATAAAVHVPK